jgi:hypothetical protein
MQIRSSMAFGDIASELAVCCDIFVIFGTSDEVAEYMNRSRLRASILS